MAWSLYSAERMKKMEKDRFIHKFFPYISKLVIVIPMLYIMLLLTANAFLHTTGMEIVPEGQEVINIVNSKPCGMETVVYYNDVLLTNIIWFLLFFAVFFVFADRAKKIRFKYLLIFVFLWTFIFGFIWVNSSMVAPTFDSMMVTEASEEFARGDYGLLTTDMRYFKDYSFQLGYVFFNEIFIRIHLLFGEYTDLIFLQVINVFMLAASYVGIMLINNKVFEDKRVGGVTALLLTVNIAPVISASFLYGIIPGFCFAVWGLYMLLVFIDGKKISVTVPACILSAFFLMLSVMLKTNNMIVLVAAVGIAVVNMAKKGKVLPGLFYIFIAVILCSGVSSAVVKMYERRSGADLGEPIPFVSWFSLGMNEASNAPGWFNVDATVGNYELNDHDPEKAAESSKRQIMDRLLYFCEDPQYANDFFYKKFVSQWNETTYQSLWNNKVRGQYANKKALAYWACYENEAGVRRYMDIYAQFVFFAVLAGLVFLIKDNNFNASIFPLVILGGVLYHIMAEAKSQYAMPYFILMSGFAGYGLCKLYGVLRPHMKRFEKNKEISTEDIEDRDAEECQDPENTAE